MESFLNGKVTLLRGDCLELLPTLEEGSIDSCVTDPPYHLTSIVKRFGSPNSAECQFGKDGAYRRASRGFMGKQWDGGDIAFRPELWAEVLRVLKPGAHLLAFSGTRTYHRMACAIEDAGFEIRDQLAFAYGSGFPKSHNVSKQLHEQACKCGLRSLPNADVSAAWATENSSGEVLLAGVSEQGASTTGRAQSSNHARGAESSLEGRGDISQAPRKLRQRQIRSLSAKPSNNGTQGWVCDGTSVGDGPMDWADADPSGVRASCRPQSSEQSNGKSGTLAGQSQPQIGGAWPLCAGCGKPIIPDGLGSALKPAWEPIVLARKPLSESSIAANVLKWGTGAINVDGCRITAGDNPAKWETPQGGIWSTDSEAKAALTENKLGRWPANLIHDGSEEVVEGFPETVSQSGMRGLTGRHDPGQGVEHNRIKDYSNTLRGHDDAGSAARFFYTAKADADDRLGSKHPTVKPLDLIQYLVRLVCPSGGTVMDPFAGTGTTGEAAFREGFRAILIEREEEYQADIVKRMGLCLAGPDERRAASVKQLPPDDLPIFSQSA